MSQFYWHIHHERLLEPLTEPIENRIAYIKARKPAEEQETRLRLMRPVRGKLPATLTKAAVAFGEARVTYDKAWVAFSRDFIPAAAVAYSKARMAYSIAKAALARAQVAFEMTETIYQPELEALHLLECPDCPWDGATIFP